MFPTVTETLGEVCSCGRELCCRQLWLKPRKPYLLRVLWSVRTLFEQTSYIDFYMIILLFNVRAVCDYMRRLRTSPYLRVLLHSA